MGNIQDRPAADAGDDSSHRLRGAPDEEAEARHRRGVDDCSSHILPRGPADESEGDDRAGAEAGDPSSLRLRGAPDEEAEARHRREVDDRSSHLLPRAPAEESEGDDLADADPSSHRLRRVPAEEAEAHDRRDTNASGRSFHLLPRALDRADADAGAPSSSPRLRRAPAVDAKAGCCRRENSTIGDTGPITHRGGRQEKGTGRDTSLPPNDAAEAGKRCGSRLENGGVRDHLQPNRQQSIGDPSSLAAQNIQVTTSRVGSGSHYIDPNRVYDLYVGGQLTNLVKYIDSFPGSVNNYHCQVIKELVYISMRGQIPEHLKFDWHVKRAETARDLASRIGYASFQEAPTSTKVLECSTEPCQRPISNICTHATALKNSNDGHIMQKIPVVPGFSDRSGCPVPDVEGINPLRFHSRHPVWGEHALAVERSKDSKVNSFFCMYCDKQLVGNANGAIKHMRKGCKIPIHTLDNLLAKVDQYKERTDQLRNAKKDVKSKGRKVTIENDVALQKIDVSKIAELIAELSQSEEYGPMDGTSGVLALTQSLITQVQKHFRDGTAVINILEYYDVASKIACDHLDHISEDITFSATDKQPLTRTCTAVLSTSDAIKGIKFALADVAVKAVLGVADFERKEVNLELVQVKGKISRKLAVELIPGIVIDCQMCHQQMSKRIEGAQIAFLSFESSMLHDEQQTYAEKMIQKCQDIGANLVICQWNFDEEVSRLFMQRKLTAVRGISDVDLKQIANFTGGKIIHNIQDLSLDKLGEARLVREKKIGRTKGQVLCIESYASPAPVTIFVHAGSNIVLQETMRKLADALCVLRSLIIDNAFVCGGGSAEISCSIAVDNAANTFPGYARPLMKSFAHALDAIPLLSVVENSALLPIDMLTMLKSRQIKENNAYFGIDCNGHGVYNMKEQQVFASLIMKKKQILLALKVLKTLLEVDAVT